MSDKSSLQTDEAVKEPMDTQSEFGEKMIQWRENAGLNRKEFARKLNVSLTAVKTGKPDTPLPKPPSTVKLPRCLALMSGTWDLITISIWTELETGSSMHDYFVACRLRLFL